ncbi:DinB family protein [Paenibacillus sp. WLX1005]|uniref:DinB family protein n=1 Tax=Paenibacillus sp. WLX1005 TaxID=3243766 RepID=UPI0039845929
MIHPHTISVREQVWNFVDTLDETILNEHAQPDQWSIAQVLEHMYLMEQAITERLNATLQQTEPTPPPLSRADGATPTFYLTLDRSRKIPAPSNLVPADKHATLQELHTRLDRSRNRLEQVVETADPEQLKQKTMNHPVFGPLTLEEWLEFIGLHEQRHLEQIKDIQSALAAAS